MVFPRSILTDHGETARRTEADVNVIEADGRFVTQSSLIFGYLASFPAKTHAIETYDYFCRYVESLPPYMRSKPRIVTFLEKFVLWAICIARKPLAEFTAADLRVFSAFSARPPETWIGVRDARFDINEGTERLSEDWKPFVQPITDPESGYVLNRFFKFLSMDLGVQPKLASCDLYRAPRMPFSEQDDSQAQAYLQYLANLTPSTKVSERSLFVCSVCYHLCLSFKEWRSARLHFSMSCFSSIGSDDPRFTMRGHLRDYSIPVPQTLIDTIARYRHGLGMSAIPSVDEVDPILTEALLNKLMWRLPKMPGLECSPSELLDRAVGFRVTLLDQPVPIRPSPSETSRQYRLGWTRKQLSKARGVIHHQDTADLDTHYHKQNRPPPLFGMHQRDVLVFTKPQAQAYVESCFPKKCFTVAMDSFEVIRAYRSCSADRLKLVALEKLLLWSIYVKQKCLHSLRPLDGREFYEFCLSPPASWTTRYAQARLHVEIKSVIPNPKWAPFVRISGGDHDMVVRAARIIDWCDNVCDSLLKIESIKINIFSNLLD